MKWMEEAVTPSRALQIHLIENLQAENVSDIKVIRKDDALDLSQQLGSMHLGQGLQHVLQSTSIPLRTIRDQCFQGLLTDLNHNT